MTPSSNARIRNLTEPYNRAQWFNGVAGPLPQDPSQPSQPIQFSGDVPQELINAFVEDARKINEDYFTQEKSLEQAKLNNTTEQTAKSYQNTVDSLNQGLRSDTQTLNAKEASSGTWASGARAERANSLASQYTNKYKSAYDNSSSALNSGLRSGEEQLGGGIDTPSINQYSANLSGNDITPTQIGQSRYNPFGGVGKINSRQNSSAQTLGRSTLQRALNY